MSSQNKTPAPRHRGLNGRSRVIRTLDPLLPKQVRYQAALYSVDVLDALAMAEPVIPPGSS